MCNPIAPFAPDRLSMTTCWPICRESSAPITREMMSGVPPGAEGTRKRMGRFGYSPVVAAPHVTIHDTITTHAAARYANPAMTDLLQPRFQHEPVASIGVADLIAQTAAPACDFRLNPMRACAACRMRLVVAGR